MTPLSELQSRVAAFTARHGLDAPVAHRLLDLASEVGEAAKEHLKATGYGRTPAAPSPAWREELGDVLFSLVALANATGVDLERALEGALAKYDARLREQGSAGSPD